MMFSDSICKECPDTGISKGAYIVFYQGGPIDHCTNVSGPFAQYSAESECNTACTTRMALAHFRILNNDFLNNDTDVVT